MLVLLHEASRSSIKIDHPKSAFSQRLPGHSFGTFYAQIVDLGTTSNPVGAQIDQVAPTMFNFRLLAVTFLRSGNWRVKRIDLLMHFGRPSPHIWYSFGSNWLLPFASLLVFLFYGFSCF